MKRAHKSLLKVCVIFASIATLAIVCWKFLITEEQLRDGLSYINSFGRWSVVVYAMLYVTLVSLSFPSSLFNITAGVLFSFTEAIIVASVSGLGAASITFFISRFLLHDYVCDKVKRVKNGNETLKLVQTDSAKVILLLRLNPFIPAVVKNYGLGVTDLRYMKYAVFTLIGQFPIAALYVYLGWMGGRAMLDQDNELSTVHWVVLGLGLIVSAFTLVASRYFFNKKLQEQGE
ncbi:VTT domain-containing protein [Alteromonas sp. ASW11-19]|uniref:TVP38/TMEM64 family membrane protein n=1 Tax=Alteromonas salexigens TaxID=2982530 RepID=A0ABT2VKZ9_9ALTE|nr:VTT domain-containing protein [Alteromonas salexigens]MCU7553981.1 VTT domain-containing protein [Alteromonas salexigens]